MVLFRCHTAPGPLRVLLRTAVHICPLLVRPQVPPLPATQYRVIKAVMTVVTLCGGNATSRHDVTANLPNMAAPLKTATDVTALLHL